MESQHESARQRSDAPNPADKAPLFTVQTTLTKKDCRKYLYWLSVARSRAGLLKVLLFSAVMAMLIVIVALPRNILWFLITFAAMLILYSIIFIISIEIQMARNGKRTNPLPLGKTLTYELYDDAVAVRGRPKRMPYPKFTTFVETKELLVLYYRQDTVLLLTKADLDPQASQNVIDFLHERLGRVYRKAYKG